MLPLGGRQSEGKDNTFLYNRLQFINKALEMFVNSYIYNYLYENY